MSYAIRRSALAILLGATIVLTVGRADAQTPTNTWIATTSSDWLTAGNWDTNSAPVSTSSTILQFNNFGSTAYTATQDIGNPFTLAGMMFNSSSSSATTITNAAANPNSLNFVNNGSSSSFLLQNNSGAITISGATTTTGTVTFAAFPATYFGGGGTGAVTISAPVVIQSDAFSISGFNTTTMSNSTSGAGITLPGENLAIYGNGIGNLTISGVASSTSSLGINTGSNNYASGVVTLSGANTFTATSGVNLLSGTLVVSNATGLGNAANVLNISGGELRVSATIANTINMNNVNLVYPGTSSGTFTGPINVSGTSGLQVLGTGGFTIDNTAAFNGPTVVGVPGIVSSTLTIGSTATTTGSLLSTSGITVSTQANSLNSGSLVLTNATAVAARLSASTPITLNSGRISYVSNSTGSNAVSLGNITINGFGGIGIQNSATDTNATALTVNSLTLANNATIGIRGEVGTGAGYTGTVTFTNGVTGASLTPLAPAGSSTPAILPWAVGFYSTSGNTTSFNSLVTTSGTNGVRVLNPTSGTDFSQVANGGGFTPGANNYYGANASNPATILTNTTLQVNSLVFADSTASQLVVSGSQGSVLQVYSGVIATPQSVYMTTPQVDFGSNPGEFYVAARTFFNSSITGSAGVVVSGYPFSSFVTNGLYLGAQNSFTGGLTINGNALVQFASDGALGATGGQITLGGGSLNFFGGGTYALTRPLFLTPAGGTLTPTTPNGATDLITLNSALVSGTGPLNLSGSGTLALSGTANGAWSTVVSSGILQFTGDSNFGSGSIDLNGGTFQPTTSGTLTRSLLVNASSTIDVGTQNPTFSGAISTLGYTAAAGTPPTLTKAGLGNLTLAANNPFVGPVTVSAGTLTLSGAGQLANATLATVNAGATLTLDNTAVNNNARYSGPVTLAGGNFNLLGNSSGSTATIGTLGANAAGSLVTLAPASGSSVQLTAAGLNVPVGGTLVVRGKGLGTTGANSSELFFGSAPVQVNGIIQGVVGDTDPVNGGGSYLVTYTATNGIVPATLTAAGGTIQNPGTLATANILASGATTVSGSANTVNSLTLASGSSLTSSGSTLTLNTGMLVVQAGTASSIDGNTTLATPATLGLTIVSAGNLTVNGPLAPGTGALIKLGAGTLALANNTTPLTLTGNITAGAGTVEVSSSVTANGLAGNGAVSIDNSQSLTLNGSGTFFGTLSGTGSLIRSVNASGSQILAGPVNLTGPIQALSGTLSLRGNVASASTPIEMDGGTNSSSNAVAASLEVAPGITISRDIEFTANGSAFHNLQTSTSNFGQAATTLAGTVTVDPGAQVTIGTNGSTINITGQLSGSGTVFLGGGSSGAGGTLNLPTANTNFSGVVKMEAQLGTVSYNTVLGIGSSSSLGTGALQIVGGGGSTLVGGGYLQALNGPQTVSNLITVQGSSTGGTTLGLVGTNALTLNSVDITNANLSIDNHSSNGSVLTINTLSGNVAIGLTNLTIGFPTTQVVNDLFPVVTAGNVVSIGTLSNGGNTTVNGGILQISGSATAVDSGGNIAGPIAVGKFGTLAGTGTINRNTEIAGTIAPGTGGASGTLTFNNAMLWDAGGKYGFAYSAVTGLNPGVNYNTIGSTSTLQIGDGSGSALATPFTINIAPLINPGSSPGAVTYTLGNFSGGISGFNAADFAFSGSFSGTPSVSLDNTNDLLQLTFTPGVVTAWTWTGTISGNWSNGGNWSPAFTPSSGVNTQLTFGATTNAAMTNDIGSFTLNSMTFNAGSPVYTLAGSGLNFASNDNGALPQIVSNSANSVTLNVPVTLTNNLTVSGSGNVTLAGAVGGAGSLTYAGSGTLTLSVANSYSGGTNVQSGTVQVAADADLGAGNVTGGSLGTLSFTGTTTSTKSFAMGGGTLAVAGGQTVTFNGGVVSSAVLDGAGTFATSAANGARFALVTATASVFVKSNNASDQFVHFDNSGAFSLAAGVNTGGNFNTTNLNGFTNEGLGSVTIGAGSQLNVANFQSYGMLNLVPATVSGQFTELANLGTAPLGFNGGSQSFVGTAAAPNANVVGVDLHGQNMVIQGGLFVNNGLVFTSTGSSTVFVDYGATYKGAGTTNVPIVTQNGGKVLFGNCPGVATFGSLVIGSGGIGTLEWEINDAGPSATYPNAPGVAGPKTVPTVSGWSLGLVASQTLRGGTATYGNLSWTATPAAKFDLDLETLAGPSTQVGSNPDGLMADFDPTQSYSWPIIAYQGVYSGPTSDAQLTADTVFDRSQFANALPAGSEFGLHLDQYPTGGGELDLVFTPSPVPEPGTLALTGLAGLAAGWVSRRRRARAGCRNLAAVQEGS